MENNTTLGAHLRALREAKGLGLREAARALEISPTFLSRVETDAERTPSAVVLGRLAALYGVDVDELLCRAGRLPVDVFEALLSDVSLVRFIRKMREAGVTGTMLLED